VLVFYGGGSLSLEKYSKGLARFSSLVEKGFPKYFLCTCAWCFFLGSWLLQQIVYGLSKMLKKKPSLLKTQQQYGHGMIIT
jgi:hypothetical protein